MEIESLLTLSITNNKEYFDYIVKRLYSKLAIKAEKFQTQLWDIAYDIMSKKSGAAVQALNSLEDSLKDYPEFYLLRSCALLRDYFVNYYSVVIDSEINIQMIEDVSAAISKGLDLKEYGIIAGISYYYLNDVVSAVEALKIERNLYDVDSPFYEIANYYLAIISIEIRSNICDVDNFLNSTFNKGRFTNILKSSISYLFDRHSMFDNDVKISKLYYYYIDDNILLRSKSSSNEYWIRIKDASIYLDIDDIINLHAGDDKSSQEYLHRLYSMIYEYESWVGETYNKVYSRDEEGIGHFLLQYEVIDSYLSSCGVEESFLLSPYINIGVPSSTTWYYNPSKDKNSFYWFDGAFYKGMATIIPFDEIITDLYCMNIITFYSSNDSPHSSYLFDGTMRKQFKENIVISNIYNYLKKDDVFYTPYNKALDALLLIENCSKESMILYAKEYSLEFDVYEAAQTAYDYGYRHRSIYTYLLECYEDNPDEINKYHNEMDMLGYTY